MGGVSLLRGPAAKQRLAAARAWLRERGPFEEVLVVAANADAVNELLRESGAARGAAFGWHRTTLPRLAGTLAEARLASAGLAPVGRLATEALVARVLHEEREEGRLGRLSEVAEGPGLARAVTQALFELRHAGITADALAKESQELANLLRAYRVALDATGLADRAGVLHAAHSVAQHGAHPLVGLPILFLDLELRSAAEQALVGVLAEHAPEVLALAPGGDDVSLGRFSEALGVEARELAPGAGADRSLPRLQSHLFRDSAPDPKPLDASVVLLSAPGESRECVEIARLVHRYADEGVPFDRMAVLLRSAEQYRPHLVESLARADVPAHFARGSVLPDPAGRAFMALLACAAEGLSATRFGEYLSLGELPRAEADGTPPAAAPSTEHWVAPDEELVSEVVAQALYSSGAEEETPSESTTLRTPRRWERLLVDAAVIGGADRWRRRLDGLAESLRVSSSELDSDDPAALRYQRDMESLDALRVFALPLIEDLAALPERGVWGRWLDALAALASRALRRPERVLSVLAELAPMRAVGPVGLEEVRLVLGRRLLETSVAPPSNRYGRVFVAAVEEARGLSFDVVFVPGLAEKLFPRKIEEDPILLDASRARLAGTLDTNRERLARERRALHLAVGAAQQRLVLSYPRLDLDGSRPRVPSFYALEALRAAEGSLPGFDELSGRAEVYARARIGWPAPSDPADAIDEAEHDLALLDSVLERDPERSVGTARYLLTANPHLGRALRFRARRWIEGWTPADGLVPDAQGALAPGAAEAIAAHALTARSFSPTALQHYAACPYKFFLYAIHKLAPREVPEGIEELDPLQRGSLVHEVQFELMQELRDASLLPVRPANLEACTSLLDRILDAMASRFHDELRPAIERVWDDGVESIRADLREWLRRGSMDDSGYEPWRFELSFGLPKRRDQDPNSSETPVDLEEGLKLRGSIDLVERRPDGHLRATDYKTGKERFDEGGIVAGGQTLQPVLYALAAEKLTPEVTVDGGRLYYCTSAGGFQDRSVPLDAEARSAIRQIATAIGAALSEPFLPAAPAEGACRWCDYRVVCGPYEEQRAGRKWKPRLEALQSVRELR
jgi:CRISPR/Cas system-associated exonuclease Cas4 (RecB family)